MKKVPVEGGVATTLCDVSTPWGASWSRDNSIVFSDGNAAGISKISAEGGKPDTLTRPDPERGELSHRLPFWLPNGKAVLFTVMRYVTDAHPWLAVLRIDTREWHALLQDAADARYVSTGHLVFLRQGTLMAVRFDAAKLEVIGQPVALLENVVQALSPFAGYHTVAGQFDISEAGSLIYAAGGIVPPPNNLLVWVNQGGMEQPVTALKFPFVSPRLSQDGQKIAYGDQALESQIWIFDLSRGTNTRLTGEGNAVAPVWTSDGKRLFSHVSNPLRRAFSGKPATGARRWSPLQQANTVNSQHSQHRRLRMGKWSLLRKFDRIQVTI